MLFGQKYKKLCNLDSKIEYMFGINYMKKKSQILSLKVLGSFAAAGVDILLSKNEWLVNLYKFDRSFLNYDIVCETTVMHCSDKYPNYMSFIRI